MSTSVSKATWEMDAAELARTYCHEVGITHRAGGHFYDRDGKHVAQGWDQMIERLTRQGIIKVGSGINWRRSKRTPGA